jgi:hypothetical protein
MTADTQRGCILVGKVGTRTWCGREAEATEPFFENATHAALSALAGEERKPCRACAGAVARLLLKASQAEPVDAPASHLAFGDGEDGVVQIERVELPRFQYETEIMEVGAWGMQGSLLRLAAAAGATTIGVSKETAQAFAAHLYQRVRVTVEVLPPAPPKTPPEDLP